VPLLCMEQCCVIELDSFITYSTLAGTVDGLNRDKTLATYRIRWSVAGDCDKAVGCLRMLHTGSKLKVQHANLKMANTADGTRSLRKLYTSTSSLCSQSDGSHDTQQTILPN